MTKNEKKLKKAIKSYNYLITRARIWKWFFWTQKVFIKWLKWGQKVIKKGQKVIKKWKKWQKVIKKWIFHALFQHFLTFTKTKKIFLKSWKKIFFWKKIWEMFFFEKFQTLKIVLQYMHICWFVDISQAFLVILSRFCSKKWFFPKFAPKSDFCQNGLKKWKNMFYVNHFQIRALLMIKPPDSCRKNNC